MEQKKEQYLIELVEGGDRIPIPPKFYRCFDTLEEAEHEARKYIDDVLPRNYVRIMKVVENVRYSGDGGSYIEVLDK